MANFDEIRKTVVDIFDQKADSCESAQNHMGRTWIANNYLLKGGFEVLSSR